MASIATSSHRSAPAGPHEREAVGRKPQASRKPQATLHDLNNLALGGKQLHRPGVGPLYRVLDRQPDEFVDPRGIALTRSGLSR